MTRQYNELESAVISALIEMRRRLNALDNPPNSMELTILASGRVLDGDLEITFRLDDCGYPSTSAKGGNLTNVVNEFVRRFEWKRHNDPLCLPKVIKEEVEDNVDL